MNTKAVSGIVLLAVIVGVAFWFFLGLPKKPTFQGRTMNQWLNMLKTSHNASNHPLEIIRITTSSKSCNAEIQLSYDLLKKYDLLEGNGKMDLVVNGQGESTSNTRATNNNLILTCNANDFVRGTNRIRVAFFIHNSLNRDRPLYAEGSITQFVSDKFESLSKQH
jgi:hypothetical protein